MESWRAELYNHNPALYHHGILGMKWGVRNGPPYPLGVSDHSASEKKAGWRKSLNSISEKDLTKTRNGGIIKTGSSVKRKIASGVKRGVNNLKTDYHEGLKAQYLEKHNKKTFFHKPEGKTEADAEKYAEGKEKALKALLIVGGVAAAYYAYNKFVPEYVDRTLKEGTEFKRVTLNPDISRAFYAARSKKDQKSYAGFYAKQLLDRRGEDSGELVKQLTIKTKGALKVASDKNATRTFADLYKADDKFREAVNKRLNSRLENVSDRIGSANLRSLESNGGKSVNNFRKLYDAFNTTLTFHGEEAGNTDEAVAQFYSALKKKGYSAINDVNDQRYSGMNAKTASIVFDVDNVVRTAIREMSDDEVKKNYQIEAGKPFVLAALGMSLSGVPVAMLDSFLDPLNKGKEIRKVKEDEESKGQEIEAREKDKRKGKR